MDNLARFNTKVRGNFKSALVVDSNLPMRRVTSDMLLKLGVRKVGITLKGPGKGREIAIKGIQSSGLDILSVEDKTGVPHNGCRTPKRRRV